MIYNSCFTYLTCQSCTARIHCEQCQTELQERLMHMRGISHIKIDIPNKQLEISSNTLDEMDLLDLLEEVSIFAD